VAERQSKLHRSRHLAVGFVQMIFQFGGMGKAVPVNESDLGTGRAVTQRGRFFVLPPNTPVGMVFSNNASTAEKSSRTASFS